jgi:3-hydroxyisobutyrate dehydrogenase-like beta-hydroxyacid dehydrogenase
VAIITASILDADFARLEHEVTRVAAAGVDAFSLDVMDDHFVPRLTFGDHVVARARNWVKLPIEIHLMVAFRLDLVGKDLDLILELARAVGAPMPQAETNRDVVRAALATGLADHDISAVAEYLRDVERTP